MSNSGFYWVTVKGEPKERLMTTEAVKKARQARRSKFIGFRPANLHTCSVCGAVDVWRDGWIWFGCHESEDGGVGVETIWCPDCAPEDIELENED